MKRTGLAGEGTRAPGSSVGAAGSAVLIAALAICAVALTVVPIHSHDTWLHLAVGRHIVESNFSVHDADPFSHTNPGAPWTPHGWLASVALFQIHGAAGEAGLIALRVALALSFIGAWAALCRGRPGALWGVALLAPLALCFAPRFLVRPQLFSSAMLLWQLVLVDHALRFRRPRLLWGLPVLFVVWINLHSGAAAGWAMLVVIAAGLSVQGRLQRHEGWLERVDLADTSLTDVRRLWLWVAIAGAAMLINPNVHHVFAHPFQMAQGWIGQVNPEHARTLTFFGGNGIPGHMVVMAILVMLTWTAALGRLHLGATALMILATGLALWRIRSAVDFALLAVALLGPAFGEVVERTVRRAPTRAALGLGRLITVALVTLAAVIVATNFPAGRFGRTEADARFRPEDAFAFLAEHRPPGEGYHPMEWGGALVWDLGESAKVYADGRLPVYGEEFYRSDYGRVGAASIQDPSWMTILDQHGVNWILLDRTRPDFRLLVEALHRNQEASVPEAREWGLVWFDDSALVFFRRESVAPQAWKSLAMNFRADIEWMRSQSPVRVRRETGWADRLHRLIDENPDNRTAVELLLTVGELTDDTELRIESLERRLTFYLTDDSRLESETALGLALGRAERHAEGAEHLRAALDLDPDSAELWRNLAATLWWLRDETGTVEAYREVQRLDPNDATAREALRAHEEGTLWEDHPVGTEG